MTLAYPSEGCYPMRSIAISDLARALNPAPGRRVLAVLYAYVDASYNMPTKGVTSVAGYVAPVDEWSGVEERWTDGLHKWGIKSFHFSGLSNDVGKDDVPACEMYFAEIIHASNIHGIGVALVNEDWTQKDLGRECSHSTSESL
jgi:hypothetical protein